MILFDTNQLVPDSYWKLIMILFFRLFFRGNVVLLTSDIAGPDTLYGMILTLGNGMFFPGGKGRDELGNLIPRCISIPDEPYLINGTCFPPNDERLTRPIADFSKRTIDVLGPGNLYGRRKELVEEIAVILEPKVNLTLPEKNRTSYSKYFLLLRDSKIVLNTNTIRQEHWDRYRFITHRLKSPYQYTGRNLEALVAGALLLTERCDCLKLLGEEGTHYVAFSHAEEGAELITWFLSPDGTQEGQTIAQRGYIFAREHLLAGETWRTIGRQLVTRGFQPL